MRVFTAPSWTGKHFNKGHAQTYQLSSLEAEFLIELLRRFRREVAEEESYLLPLSLQRSERPGNDLLHLAELLLP